MTKMLGKIASAEFGIVRDHPWGFGLMLSFKLGDGSFVGDGFRYTENMSTTCKWHTEDARAKAMEEKTQYVYDLLKKAKVNLVSDLVDIPVEVTLDGNLFKDFRILTEVL